VIVDPANGVELRRVVVGVLATNCWLVRPLGGRQALVVDPGDEPDRVLAAVDGLDVQAVVLTHAHFDHVLAAGAVAAALGVPVAAHQAEEAVWRHELAGLAATGHFDAGTETDRLLAAGAPLGLPAGLPPWSGTIDLSIVDGHMWTLGPLAVRALHTPGHTPGGITLALPGHLLTGDTLFPGGPGLTGWPLSDFATIMTSVRRLLAEHPAGTAVHPGHGAGTTVGTERPALPSWQARGW
jgi:hydroxyacylglutathione hydrolase